MVREVAKSYCPTVHQTVALIEQPVNRIDEILRYRAFGQSLQLHKTDGTEGDRLSSENPLFPAFQISGATLFDHQTPSDNFTPQVRRLDEFKVKRAKDYQREAMQDDCI